MVSGIFKLEIQATYNTSELWQDNWSKLLVRRLHVFIYTKYLRFIDMAQLAA